MKTKLFSIILCMALIFTPFAVFAENDITVVLNGESINFDVAPIIKNGRTMVPMRAVFEAFGAEVTYNDSDKKVTAKKDDKTVEITADGGVMRVNGEETALDAPAFILDSRMLVPLRAIGESLNCRVEWNAEERKVIISSKVNGANEGKIEGQIYPKVITAEGDDGNIAENVSDGSFVTRWSFMSKDTWLIFEFENICKFGYMGVAYYEADTRVAKFDIEVSNDGETWTTALKDCKSAYTLDMTAYDLGGVEAKYIKLRGYGNSANAWNSITEVAFFASRDDGQMPVYKSNIASAGRDEKDVSPELVAILEKFMQIRYSEDIENWIVSLFDQDSGAFYYSRSARDYEGFLPAIEGHTGGMSALSINLDYVTDPDLLDFTAKWREKLIKFYLDRQDPDTGYFYDPQYGKDVENIKRERDLAYCSNALLSYDTKPRYLLPSERLSASSDSSDQGAGQASGSVNTSALPEYLRSEQNLRKWLKEEIDMDNEPYRCGDEIGVIRPMAMKLGYTDIIIDYLKETQNKETGLWGKELTKASVDGGLKVVQWFGPSTEPYPNIDKMIDSVLKVTFEMGPASDICQEWNKMAIIELAMKTYKEIDPVLQEKIDKALVPMLELIYGYLMVHKRDDGGFSGGIKRSNAVCQGAYYCLGLAEGDTNAWMNTLSIINYAYTLAGVSQPRLTEEEKEERANRIVRKLSKVKPVVKKKLGEYCFLEDFEGLQKGPIKSPQFIVTGDESYAQVVVDPSNRKNLCLKIQTKGENVANNVLIPFMKTKAVTITVEYDLMLDEDSKKPYFWSTINEPSLISNTFTVEGGTFKMASRYSADGYGETVYSKFNPGEWYHIKQVFKPVDEKNTRIEYYVDDALVFSTDKFFSSQYSKPKLVKSIREMTLYNFKGSNGTLYFDNFKVK